MVDTVGTTAVVKNQKPKATFSLQGLLKPVTAPQSEEKSASLAEPVVNLPVIAENLRATWDQFAEKRKTQVAEYQILKRNYDYEHPVIMVWLANPVEETLLDNFRRDLIQFLRDNLSNSEITIVAKWKETTGKKVLYTSKEKFEHLAEKNPYLNELKERLGLDWDF